MLIDTCSIIQNDETTKTGSRHATILLLTRHVCEMLDGIAILATQGAAEPCKPLLRSAFEACLGIEYVLKADSERRGIAYQVAYAHRRISVYRRLDPTDEMHKQLQKEVGNDPILIGMEWPTMDYKSMIRNLENMLKKPEFVGVNAEFVKLKKPNWFHLFKGPKDQRMLAIHLNRGGSYEFMYRNWSNSVHAGDGFEKIGKGNGCAVMRPLRHPDGLQSMVTLVIAYCLWAGRCVLERYGTDAQRDTLQKKYTETVQERHHELHCGELLDIPWQ